MSLTRTSLQEVEPLAESRISLGSSNPWHLFFQQIDDGGMVIELVRDAEGVAQTWRISSINDAGQRFLGLSHQAVAGRTVDDVIAGLQPDWMDNFIHIEETGEPATFKMTLSAMNQAYDIKAFRIAAGKVGILLKRVSLSQHKDGLRVALLEISARLRDLTDPPSMAFAAAEIVGQTLHAARAGYATMTDHGAALRIDRDWTSAGIQSGAGMHRTTSFGQAVSDLKTGHAVVIDNTVIDQRTASDGVAGFDAYAVRSLINLPVIENGHLVAFLYVNSCNPRVWLQEEIEFALSAAEQIRVAVERRQAEQDLRDLASSLEQQVDARATELKQLWDTSPDLLLAIDFDGVFRQVNAAWTALLGYHKDELIGHHVNEFVIPDDHSQTTKAFTLVAERSVKGVVNRYRHKDGSIRWISWVAAASKTVAYATGRDITAEREQAAALANAEEALRQSQKMEAVGQLTGGLAHDFNNLLASISGSLQILKLKLHRSEYGALERYIDIGESSVRRAASLTQRLLAFSRRQTLAPQPTDINRLVAGMDDLIRRSVGPIVELEVIHAPDLWATKVDSSQLENALLNLCINARDAMSPKGGKLTLVTSNSSIDECSAENNIPPGEYVSLCATDTGMGMPPEVLERIFDPFYTTKPLGEGTGLGLSMVYGFVSQSGGQMHVHSKVGVGTTMCIYLPRYEGVIPTDVPVPAVTLKNGQGETVLVIEDEHALRELIEEVLHDAGYQVLTARDGPAGLRILDSDTRVDLLVTDVGLPGGLNGRQVADAARVSRGDLKVLFITGYADTEAVNNGQLSPGMEMMTKPFEISALANRVHALIDARP
ncbi:MAG: PAS domain S-box protein [Alphaproteobacteria bacterium]|nr:MAG: PAS domain S-box protein [Alphaproteobacteria bacterium]